MRNSLFLLILSFVFFVIAGCAGGGNSSGSSGSPNDNENGSGTPSDAVVGLSVGFKTLFSGDGVLAESGSVSQFIQTSTESGDISPMAVKYYFGTLTLLNVEDDSVAYTFNISASLDSSWNADIQQTFAVRPGTYKLNIQFQDNDYQYLGTTTATVTSGNNIFSLDVKPVIGNTVVTTTSVSETPSFMFDYDKDEFSGLSAPTMDIIVDENTNATLNLSQFTGTERVYFNISNGQHTVELLIKDGTNEIARFGPQAVDFQAGTNLNLNLIAVYGTISIDLNESGGDAVFTFSVPSEVVDEVGGNPDDLRITFSLDGTNNDPTSDVLSLTLDASGNYLASTTLTGIQYDTLSVDMLFQDTSVSPDETIGSCNLSLTLDSSASSAACEITLIRRAIISGNFYQVVGINVIDTTGAAVSGASVYIDGDKASNMLLGTTGPGAFGTDGYLEARIIPGKYSFRAELASQGGSVTDYTVKPGEPGYVLIKLSDNL